MFSRVTAIEAKRDGIRVNVITPSLIADTPTAERVLRDGFSKKLFEKAASLADRASPSRTTSPRWWCSSAGPARRV